VNQISRDMWWAHYKVLTHQLVRNQHIRLQILAFRLLDSSWSFLWNKLFSSLSLELSLSLPLQGSSLLYPHRYQLVPSSILPRFVGLRHLWVESLKFWRNSWQWSIYLYGRLQTFNCTHHQCFSWSLQTQYLPDHLNLRIHLHREFL